MTSNLVALYTFEELSGTTVKDMSGRGKPVDSEFIGPNAADLKWLTGTNLHSILKKGRANVGREERREREKQRETIANTRHRKPAYT